MRSRSTAYYNPERKRGDAFRQRYLLACYTYSMRRRHFLQSSFLAGSAQAQTPPATRELEAGGTGSTSFQVRLTIERRQSGKPHQGKVLAAIQPHCDDIPI